MRSQLNFVLLVCFLSIAACGGGSSNSNTIGNFTASIPVFAVKNGSVYQPQLEPCTYNLGDRSCTFNALPLLGMEKNSPTVNDVLQRTLVTHQWMADNFETLLNQYPSSMLKLFRGVTAVIIAADVRPAYYHPNTGAIYLDPNYLWFTQEQKQQMDRSADFRSGFGQDLQYLVPSRYIKDNQYAYNFYSLDDTSQSRPVEETKYFLARLLVHELAHANDAFPPSSYNSMDRSKTAQQLSAERQADYVSAQMQTNYSLQSVQMKRLADVNFRGATATQAENNLHPDDIRDEIRPDLANDDYSYSTDREDLAMLAEETMMLYMFDIERDVAVTHLRNSQDELIISWGERCRVAKDNITAKAKFIFDRILPDENLSNFYSNIGDEHQLTRNADWFDEVIQTKSFGHNHFRPDDLVKDYR